MTRSQGIITWAHLFVVLSCGFCRTSVQAEPRAAHNEPYQIVQRVRVAQDAIARVGASALAPYQHVLEDSGAMLRQSPAASWQNERNASALVIFVLSGGSSAVADTILDQPQFNESVRPLLKASLAFVKGRAKTARELLTNVDLESVPPTLRGNLALTRGILFSHELPLRARREYSLARLYAPGGVVEQVALRLEIELSKRDGVNQGADELLRLLLTRFPNSLHVPEAIETVANLTSRAEAGRLVEISESTAALLAHIPRPLQLALSIGFARQGALRGRAAFAGDWARRASALAQEGTAERNQAGLYGAAAAVLLDHDDGATRALSMIDPARLPKRDMELLQAAIMVDQHIRSPVDPPPPLDPAARREPDDSSAMTSLEPEAVILVKQANVSLDRVNRLLEAYP